FDWEGDQAPDIAAADTVIYELHVKAFSKRNPAIPAELRGSYAALGHPASIAHFKRLGVTTLELLPVHYHIDEQRLVGMGLSNHWGYNTLGFFCPDPKFAAGIDGQTARDEFRSMVKTLHREGFEIILDVVYNHTAEGDLMGPSLSFRGLDNASYYRHDVDSDHRSHLDNFSGCGNTLDIRQPAVLQLVMDSLRFWADEMHVDGFRFDLAPVLGRGDLGFYNRAAFFAALAQDPLLSHVKLIAEPWDSGPDGYQVGNFPRGWLEWNDHFRDTMRGFWLHMGQPGAPTRADFALRLCGSSDLFENRSRRPAESVNYVVSHDGFSLLDLVSYRDRHNHANGENNQDGHQHNLSFNCGIEGPTDDEAVNALRSRLRRVLLATALFSQGTPMLAAGDELGHGQGGNNNPYCQDNEITWIDWSGADHDLIEFTARVLSLRRRLQPFANDWYSTIRDSAGAPGLAWLRSDGQPLEADAWHNPDSRVLGCLIGHTGRAGTRLLLLVNGDTGDRNFDLPAGRWKVEFDSIDRIGAAQGQAAEAQLLLPAHSLLLLAPDNGD
ncbi:MAG: glycogen debranching protein GlgX, partial [Ideonella sp.]